MFQNLIKHGVAILLCALSLSVHAVDFSGVYVTTEADDGFEYVRVRAHDPAVDGALVLPKALEGDDFLNDKVWLIEFSPNKIENQKPLIFREVLFEPDEWKDKVLSSNTCLAYQDIENAEHSGEMMMFCLTQKNAMLKDKKLEDALFMVLIRFGSAKVILKKVVETFAQLPQPR